MNQYRARYLNLAGNTVTSDPFNGIILDRTNEVKRAGYRSANDQIAELMRSGTRLQEAREERYAKPTGLAPRHYGEIDPVVADEKIEAIKDDIRDRKTKAWEETQAKKAAEEAASKVETPPEGGGVT